jgi:predicted phosphodiesterase
VAVVSFMGISCPHCPLACPEALEWLLELIEENDPDYFVLVGDLHEADAASKFESEYPFSLEQEFDASNDYLLAIRRAHERKRKKPAGSRVFMFGNHDQNLLEWNRINRKLRGICDFTGKVRGTNQYKHIPELEHWKLHKEYTFDQAGVFRIGQVGFTHGFESARGSNEAQALILNRNHPNSLLIAGHSHKPIPVTQIYKGEIDLPYHYCNVGTMGPLKPRYMARKRTIGWGAACVIGEALETKSPRLTKNWDAELKVFRMARDLKGGITPYPSFKDAA